MRYLCLFLACILAGCGSTATDRSPKPPERARLRVLQMTSGPEWPDVCANGDIAGRSARTMLEEIQAEAGNLAGTLPVGDPQIAVLDDVKAAAERRKSNIPFYRDGNGAHGRLYTPRQAWARVALAWAYAKADQWDDVKTQLEMHSEGQLLLSGWSDVSFAPDLMGRTYLELIGQPAGWNDGPPDPIDGPPPELLDQLLLRLDSWSNTPDPPLDENRRRIAWVRILLAYYAAGLPGDPNWYLCVDELDQQM